MPDPHWYHRAALAKKARTPPPPRRPVQAPTRRVDARDPGDSRRAFMILAVIGLLGLVMLAGVLIWLSQRGGGDSQEVADKMRAADCTYSTTKAEGREHVRDGTRVKYKTFPPTSGNHYATPLIWNLYDEPLEQESIVHNLEHGGVAIQYGREVPQETVAEMRDSYLDDPNGIIFAPLPRLGDKIALTAWTHIAKCNRFDESAVEAFLDAFRAKGPERIPLSELTPGHG